MCGIVLSVFAYVADERRALKAIVVLLGATILVLSGATMQCCLQWPMQGGGTAPGAMCACAHHAPLSWKDPNEVIVLMTLTCHTWWQMSWGIPDQETLDSTDVSCKLCNETMCD